MGRDGRRQDGGPRRRRLFYDRYSDDNILDLIELPPVLNTYTTNYTTLPELLSNPLTATPTAVRYIDEFIPPVVYNWSLGVQREIGFQLVADVAYVGNAARDQHQQRRHQRPALWLRVSAVQPGSDQRLAVGRRSRCPTICCGRTADTARSPSATFAGYGDYHALQFAVNRRRTRTACPSAWPTPTRSTRTCARSIRS